VNLELSRSGNGVRNGFGDRMGVVVDSSRNPLPTRSMWRATGLMVRGSPAATVIAQLGKRVASTRADSHGSFFDIERNTAVARAHIRARYMMVALLDSAILRNLHLGRTRMRDKRKGWINAFRKRLSLMELATSWTILDSIYARASANCHRQPDQWMI